MSVRIYVPADSAALALGADDVAATIQCEAARRGIAIDLVRNGTRGLLYLEPLVEVETPGGRIGFGNGGHTVQELQPRQKRNNDGAASLPGL